MNYFFETYGCQMNTAESAALRLTLQERGWSQAADGDRADVVILNTCSVRATAERRVMGRLAQYGALKKKRRFTLIVAGCMASRLGETLKTQVPAVDYVMGTSARAVFPHILEALERGIPFQDDAETPAFSFSAVHLEEGRFRSFIPIMHGCDNFCSYCIVPYVRGRETSRNPADILEEIHLLAEKGVREITLLGQNVNSYRWEEGKKLDFPDLLELVSRELEKTPIRWARFLSSHPKDLSSRVIRVMAEHPVFCRHLHLCVQHGSNAVLTAMNRRYSRERYLELAREIREAMPDISLSTDILIGFPGETEEDLAQTLDLMEEVRFLYAYMYHYNPREGTPAWNLPGRIDEETKRKRLAQVIALQKRHTQALLQARIGRRETVLIEGISRKNADELITRTERDEMVAVPGKPSMIGSFAELTLSSLRGNTFHAKEILLCPGD
ncbi:MAG: tRNA (N6-isopentenyl adenosine(37)-C2)-methylthiotransferase MiaB [Spirochaetaceae bacterium]|nr:tRNA (N6-isopentenyl adenosine(37)-C2)-methylthiotransferase MiaB [Spirochaetaceae bacterium]